MNQARVLVLTGPRQLAYMDAEITELGENDLRLETLVSGISHGTEMNVYRGVAPQWTKVYDRGLRLFRPADQGEQDLPACGYFTPGDSTWRYPLAYGYANVGRVIEAGSAVTDIVPGDLVYTYSPHQTESVVPAANAIPLPSLSDPALGVLYANMNTAYNGVLDTDFRIDDVVVVFGQGAVGLLVTQYLRHAGVKTIITVEGFAKRQELSLQMGATECLNPFTDDVALAVRERTGGRGADVVIEVSGNYAALQEAIRTAAPDTTVTVMSWYGGTGDKLALSDEFHHNRISLKSSQVGAVDPHLSATHSMKRRFERVRDSFGYLDLAPLISHRVAFAEAQSGYELVDTGNPDITQVVLTY